MGSKRGTLVNATISLADALFTKTQQGVFGLLFGQPDRAFLQKELIDGAGSGSGSVRRELERLSASGLVTVTRNGAQKYYQANRAAPVFEELRSIVLRTVVLIDPVRTALRPLAKKIRLALLFGSVARGEMRAGSDVDLLVVADDLRLEELFARLGPVEAKLGRPINPTLYTAEEFARRRAGGNPFLKKVLASEPIILIGDLEP